jgi:hypothetical protein
MRYLILLHVDESGWTRLTAAERARGMEAYGAFDQALAGAGALVASGRLTPSLASTQIRTIGGKAVAMDGPYAETKEQVGGFYLIEAPDRAAALAWAQQCPAAGHGTVEVREVAG